MWIFVSASETCSCWTSVFTATNSTWLIPASIIRLTAFRPAPPTPTTWILARYEPSEPTRAWCRRCAASVALKSSASGPSRMLARFRAIEHLLREVAVELGRIATRVVAEHGLALHGSLRVANGLADPRLIHQVTKVLFQDLHSLA